MDFNFYMPARILSGKGVVLQNSPELKALGGRCLIVTGARSAKESGALDDAFAALEKEWISYSVYDKIQANPLADICQEAGNQAREMDADFILGIGGGSPLDSAKAAAIYATNPGLTTEGMLQKKWKNPPLPLVLIGTTSGTGSEVSSTSVLTWEDGRKRAVTHPDLYADLVFADPQYTYSMNRELSITTALDAFSHAAEGFLNPVCTDIAALCAQKAMPVLWEGLKAMDAREPLSTTQKDILYYASLWAGLVLNAMGTAFPHPFGYILTEDYNIPHGRACATFLPALVLCGMENSAERTTALFDCLNCTYSDLSDVLTRLSATSHIHMTAKQIEAYSTRWEHLKNFKNVPGGFDIPRGITLFRGLFLDPQET